MATEILNLEVKSNIKGAVTDVDALGTAVQTTAERYTELNENISIQNEYIETQETELIRLKAIQDSIPKGAWFAGQSKLSDDINSVTSEIRSEKDALKKLKREQKDVATAIRDKTSAQNKDTKAAIRGIEHFSIMGVSLRRVKNMIRGVIPMFKLLFTTIKSGIISTGIGAIVLALIAIGTAMKKSVAGGKAFKAMMAGIGVVTGAITDALTFLGDLMLSVFGFDSSTDAAVTAAENLANAYINLGREMDNIALRDSKNATQKALNKKIIDDITKSEEERIAAAMKNADIDKKIWEDELDVLIKKEKLDAESFLRDFIALENLRKARKERDEMSEEETEAREAMLESEKAHDKTLIALEKKRFDGFVQSETFKKGLDKIRKTQIDENIKTAQEQAKADALAAREKLRQLKEEEAALQELMDLEADRLNNQIINSAKLLDDFYASQLEAQDRERNAIIDKWNFAIEAEEEGSAKRIELEEAMQSELDAIDVKYKALSDKRTKENKLKIIAADEAVKKSKLETTSAIGGAIGALGGLMKEGSDAAKAAALAEIAINTGVGIIQGLDIAQKSAKAMGPGAVYAFPVFFATQLAAVLAAAAQAKTILGAGAGGDGGSLTPTASAQTPAPQMMSGAFELTGGQEVEPVQAYVVSDNITDSQNGLAIIRRRATI
jgi:hypothetical protein